MLCADAFGRKNRRADVKFLSTLPLGELIGIYSQAMEAVLDRNVKSGKYD
jgi:hypothetical protein